MKKLMMLASCAAFLGLASPAAASTVSLTFNGFENGSVNVHVASPTAVSAAAGGFAMSGPAGDFVAWCIDIFTYMAPAGAPRSYDVERPVQITDVAEADLNRLFSNNFDVALASPINSAAFQLAIWEIVYDASGTYDLSDGAFQVTSSNASVLSTASGWLQNLGTAAGTYALTFYSRDDTQDLVTGAPSPVPLPAGVLLLGTGLGALAVARRRRKAA